MLEGSLEAGSRRRRRPCLPRLPSSVFPFDPREFRLNYSPLVYELPLGKLRRDRSPADSRTDAGRAGRDGSGQQSARRTQRAGGKSVRTVRSIFISDLHLGSRYARVEELLCLLGRHSPEHVFLVGDFIDARAIHVSPHWSPRYDAVFNRLAELAAGGTSISYTPGNHDDYLRHVEVVSGDVTVQDQFMHHTVDGRRVAVLHGDQFDQVEHRAHWLSLFGSFLYTVLLAIDRAMNHVLRLLGCRPRRLSRWLKQTTKRIVQWISGFEGKVLDHAQRTDCDVIVCGHIHIPSVRRLPGRLYFNLGDWIENTTALLEYADGELELVDLESEFGPPRRGRAGVLADGALDQTTPTPRAQAIKQALLVGLPV